jgi:hypothetical protein
VIARPQKCASESQGKIIMKNSDEMFSVGEIIQSKEFEREAPKGFSFEIRRVLRDKRRKETKQTQNVNKTKKKNISLAK